MAVCELSVPFLVLIVPLSFPALGHLGRWRPRWRDEVGHSSYCGEIKVLGRRFKMGDEGFYHVVVSEAGGLGCQED